MNAQRTLGKAKLLDIKCLAVLARSISLPHFFPFPNKEHSSFFKKIEPVSFLSFEHLVAYSVMKMF